MKKVIVSMAVLLMLTGCQGTDQKIEEANQPEETTQMIVVEKPKVAEIVTLEDYLSSRSYRLIEKIATTKDHLSAIIYEDDNGQHFGFYNSDSKELVHQVKLLDNQLYIDIEVDRHLSILEEKFNFDQVIAIQGDPIASSPGRLMLIGLRENEYYEVFNADIANWYLEDLNDNVIPEIIGTTQFGGQVIYDVGFKEVYEFRDNAYQKSFLLTQQVAINDLQNAITAFRLDENIDTFNSVIKNMAYLGDGAGCENMIDDNQVLLQQHKELMDANHPEYMNYYFNFYQTMVDEYAKRWQVIKYENEIQSIEAANDFTASERRVVKVINVDNDSSNEILVSYSNEINRDYEKSFIIDDIDGQTLVTQIPELTAYYVDAIEVVDFPGQRMIYLKVTNGVHDLGCRLYGYDDGKLEEYFNEASPSGAGNYKIYDMELDGTYDTIVKSLSDYLVFNHFIQTYYRWNGERFAKYRVRYALDEITNEPEKVIYQFLDMLWLEKNYGETTELTKQLQHYLGNEEVLTADVSNIVDNMYSGKDADYENRLDISLVTSDSSFRTYSVKVRDNDNVEPMIFTLEVGETTKINDIQN